MIFNLTVLLSFVGVLEYRDSCNSCSLHRMHTSYTTQVHNTLSCMCIVRYIFSTLQVLFKISTVQSGKGSATLDYEFLGKTLARHQKKITKNDIPKLNQWGKEMW